MSALARYRAPNISVLDFGIIAPGRDGASVLRDTFEFAVAAERLGYNTFWVAEHHEAHFAWGAPAIVMAALGQRTTRIRIGSAAILLPLYNPLQVAETFRTLAALYPARIDLGVCAGVPEDKVALAALSDLDLCASSDSFVRKLPALEAFLHGRFEAGHRFAFGATPQHAMAPALWVMGSSERAARRAGANRAHFAYSLFHRGSSQEPSVAQAFREACHARGDGFQGRVQIAATCICAETEVAAQAQRRRVEHWLQNDLRVLISGTKQQCHEQIVALVDRFDADDVTLFHLWHEQEPRLAALRAIADAFKLATHAPEGDYNHAP